jgi:hypothetical protein
VSAPVGDGAESRTPAASRLLLGWVAAVSVLLYVGTSYGVLRSPRFLFPLYVVLPVVAAVGSVELDRWRRNLGLLLWLAVITINLAQQLVVDPALAMQPAHLAERVEVPPSYDELVGCLDRIGCNRVYGAYWTAFPLIWASGERIMVSDGRPGRLPEADEAVGSSERVAFVLYRDKLDERFLRRLLRATGTPHQVVECGPFRVYAGIDARTLRGSPAWDRVRIILSHP